MMVKSILIATYALLKGVILNDLQWPLQFTDLAKYSITRSNARSLCGSRSSCWGDVVDTDASATTWCTVKQQMIYITFRLWSVKERRVMSARKKRSDLQGHPEMQSASVMHHFNDLFRWMTRAADEKDGYNSRNGRMQIPYIEVKHIFDSFKLNVHFVHNKNNPNYISYVVAVPEWQH